MALSGKDDDGSGSDRARDSTGPSSCNKVVDMPVMVSSNRSRENESRSQF